MKQPQVSLSIRDRFSNSILSTTNRRTWLAITAVMFATTMFGCNKMINRGQSPDDEPILKFNEPPTEGAKYISDTCGMWGMNYAKIEGIGLAVDLDGTGSVANPGGFRDHLFRELKTREEIENPKDLMASKNTEIVIVKGAVPPGLRKGELFDLEILSTPKTEGTSIEGGTVLKTRMRMIAAFGNRLKEGLVVGLGRGSVLVDSVFESRQDEPNNKSGWILGGGVILEDRPIGLTVRTDTYSAKTTVLISSAINERFKTMEVSGREGIAVPTTDRLINLKLPEVYKNNATRFASVIRSMKYNETPDQKVNRLDELERQLADPATAGEAALRLEAIGKTAIPTLKRALNNPDLEIRFHAAQALTYCGQDDGIEILHNVVVKEPAFRWYALTALSASKSKDATNALAELTLSQSSETRYGAFHSLRNKDKNDPLVQGTWMTDFYLHQLPGKGESMLHLSRSKRPEIVLFGEQTMGDEFLYVESGVTIRSNGNGTIGITEYYGADRPDKSICSNSIRDLIETLAEKGFQYGELVKIFRHAKKTGSLESRLVVDALPRRDRAYDGDNSDASGSMDAFASEDTPELFNGGPGEERKLRRVDTDLVTGNELSEEEKEESVWSKMRPKKFRISDYMAE